MQHPGDDTLSLEIDNTLDLNMFLEQSFLVLIPWSDLCTEHFHRARVRIDPYKRIAEDDFWDSMRTLEFMSWSTFNNIKKEFLKPRSTFGYHPFTVARTLMFLSIMNWLLHVSHKRIYSLIFACRCAMLTATLGDDVLKVAFQRRKTYPGYWKYERCAVAFVFPLLRLCLPEANGVALSKWIELDETELAKIDTLDPKYAEIGMTNFEPRDCAPKRAY